MITEPKLLLADEPTGALDSKTSDELLSVFSKLNAEGQTILMVTIPSRRQAMQTECCSSRTGRFSIRFTKEAAGMTSFTKKYPTLSP